MNWKLVGALSMFGLAMGVATVFVIPSKIEPLVWLAIFALCAVLIARAQSSKHFLHGLSTSLANSVWMTGAHLAFFDTYVASHSDEAKMMVDSPIPGRVMMLITGPIIGLVSGLVLGLFAFLAGKFIKTSAA